MTDEYFKLTRPKHSEKKWQVVVPTESGRGRTVAFGDASMEDYTIHKDKDRRENYRRRHQHDRLDDPYSPGFWSWYALWGESSNLKVAFADAVRRAKRLLGGRHNNPSIKVTPAQLAALQVYVLDPAHIEPGVFDDEGFTQAAREIAEALHGRSLEAPDADDQERIWLWHACLSMASESAVESDDFGAATALTNLASKILDPLRKSTRANPPLRDKSLEWLDLRALIADHEIRADAARQRARYDREAREDVEYHEAEIARLEAELGTRLTRTGSGRRNPTIAEQRRDIHERVAEALGWSVEEARSFSLQALRDLVRPVSAKLAQELTSMIQGGSYIVGTRVQGRARTGRGVR